MQTGEEVFLQDDWAQFYAFLSITEVKASDAVIIGTILVFDWMGITLSDPGSTYSYVLINFSLSFDAIYDVLDTPFMFPLHWRVYYNHSYLLCLLYFIYKI